MQMKHMFWIAGGVTALIGAAPLMAADAPLNFDELIAAVDADHDGKLTQAEWAALELPEPPFGMMANGRGFITPDDLRKSTPPAEVDTNHDGKLTAPEFAAYGKERAKNPPKDRPPLPSGQ